MKKAVIPFLSLCLFGLLACHKDHVASGNGKPTDTSGTTTSLGEFKINLVSSEANWSDSARTDIELIISEPGGKVLLDTITPANAVITAALSTNAATVDVTNIYYNTSLKIYSITTYKGVNPSSWAGNYNRSYYYPSGPRPALVSDTLLYVSMSNIQNVQFSQNPFSLLDANVTFPDSNSTTILTEYPMVQGNYAYLLLGNSGLYKMIIPTQSYQSIDCSQMDTAAAENFSLSSSYYYYYYTLLNGYSDSTNLNSQLTLFVNTRAVPGKAQIVFPTKNIQKYALLGIFQHDATEYASIYSCGNAINPSITCPDPTSYTISSNQNNDFSVVWNSTKPTYYLTNWTNSSISWTLYASPDSSTLNPLNLLTAQKSKMLQGQDLTTLALSTFVFETVQGYNYSGYLGLVCDSAQLWKSPVSSGILYSKGF